MKLGTLFVAIAWIFAATASAANDPGLSERLLPLIDAHQGRVAVAVRHLENGASFEYRAAEPLPTASLIKLPVMIAAYQAAADGQLDLAKELTLRAEDKAPGSGVLTPHFSPGAKLSVRDAIRLMIAYSDNTATNLVVDQIGLPATANLMASLGFPETRLHAKVFRGDTSIAPERSKQFGLGSTTALDMISLLERLQNGEVVSPEASREMLEHLRACDDKDRLSRHLPAGTKIAMKTGSVNNARTVAGIIDSPAGAIAICVLTTENQDKRWTADNAAVVLMAEISRQAWQRFQPLTPLSDPGFTGELVLGTQGEMVEALQRTLNARLQPSPNLNIDGDFGAVTRQAVVAFQKQAGLPETGVVGPESWAALGSLLLEDAPVSDPEVINSEKLPREPADPAAGPPFVTCKAWCVGDAATGGVLFGKCETDRLHIASTTKVMTAWLTLKTAAEDPTLLDQEVTFSARADQTIGSSARVRAGEKLPVRDLLYGLMLPSGNDASVALGEALGGRFAPAEGAADPEDSLGRFIAEMNREAGRLGMTSTVYSNTHGLTEDSHLSTAADLLKLTSRALQDDRFRQIIQCRQYGCRVEGKGGYRRNVKWENTNRLLGTDGYLGVKTGTTNAAGACLVSVGERNGRELIVVVLGAAASEARYAETRNLFRWAWTQVPSP